MRLQGVGVLGFAADAVALGHVFCGVQHRHVSMSGVAHDVLVALVQGPVHVAGLHRADVFLTGADGHLHAVDHDLLGSSGDRHQAGGALTVQSLPADREG
ncbi:hypothetical protein D9M70_516470 [compost metagenome]